MISSPASPARPVLDHKTIIHHLMSCPGGRNWLNIQGLTCSLSRILALEYNVSSNVHPEKLAKYGRAATLSYMSSSPVISCRVLSLTSNSQKMPPPRIP